MQQLDLERRTRDWYDRQCTLPFMEPRYHYRVQPQVPSLPYQLFQPSIHKGAWYQPSFYHFHSTTTAPYLSSTQAYIPKTQAPSSLAPSNPPTQRVVQLQPSEPTPTRTPSYSSSFSSSPSPSSSRQRPSTHRASKRSLKGYNIITHPRLLLSPSSVRPRAHDQQTGSTPETFISATKLAPPPPPSTPPAPVPSHRNPVQQLSPISSPATSEIKAYLDVSEIRTRLGASFAKVLFEHQINGGSESDSDRQAQREKEVGTDWSTIPMCPPRWGSKSMEDGADEGEEFNPCFDTTWLRREKVLP